MVPLGAERSPQGQEDLPGQAGLSPSRVSTKAYICSMGNGVNSVVCKEKGSISWMRWEGQKSAEERRHQSSVTQDAKGVDSGFSAKGNAISGPTLLFDN